jgi:hypothetical protein
VKPRYLSSGGVSNGVGGGVKHFHLKHPFFLIGDYSGFSFVPSAAVKVKGFLGTPQTPAEDAVLCTPASFITIILAGHGLLVYVLGILIPGRVVRAAMVVESTSMSAYRLMDQDTGKGRLDFHSANAPG